jgi:hypothetical protein
MRRDNFLAFGRDPLTLKVLRTPYFGIRIDRARRRGQSKLLYNEALAKCQWHIALPRISSSLSSANKAALQQFDQNVLHSLRKSLTVHGDPRISILFEIKKIQSVTLLYFGGRQLQEKWVEMIPLVAGNGTSIYRLEVGN